MSNATLSLSAGVQLPVLDFRLPGLSWNYPGASICPNATLGVVCSFAIIVVVLVAFARVSRCGVPMRYAFSMPIESFGLVHAVYQVHLIQAFRPIT